MVEREGSERAGAGDEGLKAPLMFSWEGKTGDDAAKTMLLRRCMLLSASVKRRIFFAQTPIWGFEDVSGTGRWWKGSKKGYKRLRLSLLEAAGVRIKWGVVLIVLRCGMVCAVTKNTVR